MRVRHRVRAVAGQPVRPVREASCERVRDQQRAKARAVDKEFAADFLAAFEDYRFDMAAFAIAFDAFDLAPDPHDACTLCNLAQIRGIKRGVEMKGMGDAVEAPIGRAPCRERGSPYV